VKSESNTSLDKLNKLALLGTTALVASFGVMTPAYAQDSTQVVEDSDEIVTTGIRQSLKSANDLKRNADTAIDSITASDVGALPDLSVAEALARIPGVVAQRFDITNNNGGDFPSPEGGGNLIRGLTLVRSEFNGRDTFSANGGRSLDFGTIPPELIGAVDVYKNTSADLIEGGIGGTINLRTLEPFDQTGTLAQVTVDGTYTDLRKEFSPEFSVILGDRWDMGDGGEFGLLGSFSSSELKSELHGFQIGQVVPFNTGTETIGLPGGFQLRTNEIDRERDSYYIAGQWRDASGDLQVTAKYSLIENDTDSDERTLEFFPDGESFNQFEVDGLTTTPFTSSGIPNCQGGNDGARICENTVPITGLYESGVISNNLRDWTGADGAPFTNLGINQVDSSKTDDISLNIKWRATDRLFVSVDGHKTTAEFDRQRLWAGTRFFSNFELNADLDDPFVILRSTFNNNPNRRAGPGGVTNGDFTDPSNSNFLFMADEFQENDGEMYAIRGDVEYEFDNDGWFDGVKFGARYADREQVNRSAGLNWAAVAPPWTGGYLPYDQFSGGSGGELVNFGGFFRGGVVRGGQQSVIFADRNLLQNYQGFVDAIAGEGAISQRVDDQQCDTPFTVYGDWAPLLNNGFDGVDYNCRGSVGDVREKVQNYYGRLDFGNEFDNGMSIEGNIGVRYTSVDVSGLSGSNFINVIEDRGPDGDDPVPSDFSPEAVDFFNQADIAVQDADLSSDDAWLPSLNLKWNLNDQSLIRFAASKAITRPRIDQLRGNQVIVPQFQFITDNDPNVPADDREVIDIPLNQINIFSGNPNLKPIESTNLDVSFEHYFGDSNSFTLSLFSKDITNNIVYGEETLDVVTLDGRQVPIVFNGDLNQDEAKIKGLEVAYLQFYDELPGILGNLGLQANYTYIDANTNAPRSNVTEGDPDFDFQRIFRYDVEDFLGLSDHAANIIGIYEDEKLEMRLAYNWRSEYLSSYRDFVTGNPIYQQATGYLDGSVKYDFNDNFQVRAQIANITNEKANAEQQIDADGQRFGRTSFVGDRRIKIGARYKF
jgi:TonB-dependent receptor